MGVVFAFRESLFGGGTTQTRHALGYRGARLIAAQQARKPPSPRAHAEYLERLGCWPKLDHQLGVNDFFVALAAHRNPACRSVGAGDQVEGLTQWWSERRCGEFFWKPFVSDDARIHPDGYGCWEEHGRRVRFFLEYDTGTESLPVLTRKLIDYQNFPTNVYGIVLLSVHSARCELALRTALRRVVTDPNLVIATAARDCCHPDGPAGPVWALWTPGDGDTPPARRQLADLPELGSHIDHHTTDQPYNEAGFDPHDRAVHDLMFSPSERANRYRDPYADDDPDDGMVDLGA